MSARAWRTANPEKVREYSRRYRNANAEKVRARSRDKHQQKYHGITAEERDLLVIAQRGCACCGTDDPGTKLGWSTDHDHETGVIRGIMCRTCNLLLGHLGDNLNVARVRFAQVETYLERTAKVLTTLRIAVIRGAG